MVQGIINEKVSLYITNKEVKKRVIPTLVHEMKQVNLEMMEF